MEDKPWRKPFASTSFFIFYSQSDRSNCRRFLELLSQSKYENCRKTHFSILFC
uniref:Candidate secreted effector n=1 Tax=Meloidogyne incognita TaxID=6306 RepID=A0A914NK53_MELIC